MTVIPPVDQPAAKRDERDHPGPALTEAQRRPLIDVDGRRLLTDLLEHAHAPHYNHTCGDRLTASGLARVRAFDVETATAAPFRPGRPPAWLAAFIAHALEQVPRYRRTTSRAPARLEDLPTTSREDLLDDPYAFVPDDHPLDDLVVFTTTGTTDGRTAFIASTPEATASYAVLVRAALRTRGLTLDGGPGRTAIAQVCWQRSTYTYASVSSFLGQAALLKLNLNPTEWRAADDPAAFLDAVAPEVISGDPVAFTHLLDLGLTHQPKALVSTAMTLLDGLRDRLEAALGCPVIDIYGMNEAGPIAASLPTGAAGAGGGHVVLQPRLYVELLGPDGRPVPVGERGEITLTGGFNTALPLLRYRTGDHASFSPDTDLPVLVGLEGRPPVPFASLDGRALNTIDVTVALRHLAAARYTLHQHADRSLTLALDESALDPTGDAPTFRAALTDLFAGAPLTIHPLPRDAPESVTYTSAL